MVQRNRNEGRRGNSGIIGQETIASRVHDYEKFLQKVTQNLMADLHKYFSVVTFVLNLYNVGLLM